jgi:hypothetical protein
MRVHQNSSKKLNLCPKIDLTCLTSSYVVLAELEVRHVRIGLDNLQSQQKCKKVQTKPQAKLRQQKRIDKSFHSLTHISSNTLYVRDKNVSWKCDKNLRKLYHWIRLKNKTDFHGGEHHKNRKTKLTKGSQIE